MIEIPSIPNYPNYQMDSTLNAEIKYNYTEKTIFNRILIGLAKIFGSLECNEMKVNNMSYISPLNNPKHDQFEYEITNNMVDLNERGKDGWEMVTIIPGYENSKEIIWKRKL